MRFTLSLLSVIGVAQAAYRSGSVSSYEKFKYGKFVTRMKAPDRKGTVASFFTYWDGPGFFPGGWNELDIEIAPSMEKNPLSLNVLYGDGKKTKLEQHDYAHGFNPRDEWHTYEMEWTPQYISFSIDGVEMRHLDDTFAAVKAQTKAQNLRMNFWTPTGHPWGEGLNDKDMPWYALYDYVEVFTWNEHTNEFDFKWRDDFEDFDQDRWHKAEGGFESNTSEFHHDNVYTSHGKLVLKMEPIDAHKKEHQLHT